MTEPSKWSRIIAADPDHSRRYIERFKMMEAAGHDLYGEARTVDAMVERNSRILDAGCGPGRLGGRLFELDGDGDVVELLSGQAVFVPAHEPVSLRGEGQLFVAASGA